MSVFQKESKTPFSGCHHQDIDIRSSDFSLIKPRRFSSDFYVEVRLLFTRLRKLYKDLAAEQRPMDNVRKQQYNESCALKERHCAETEELEARHRFQLDGLGPAREKIDSAADALEKSMFDVRLSGGYISYDTFEAYLVRVDGSGEANAASEKRWRAETVSSRGPDSISHMSAKFGICVPDYYVGPAWLARTGWYRGDIAGCLHLIYRKPCNNCDGISRYTYGDPNDCPHKIQQKREVIRQHIEGLRIVDEREAMLDYDGVRCDRDPRPGGRRDPRMRGSLFELC